MTEISYAGQLGIFDPGRFYEPVHIIGAGGIGSALFEPLCKLGVREVHVWDTDLLEVKNIPYQMIYRSSDAGRPKVELLAEYAERQEFDCTVIPHTEWVTPDTELEGIVMSGVDSMKSRMAIWQAVEAQSGLIPLYIDGRIGGEHLMMFALDPSDAGQAKSYQSWLYPDSEAAPLPCAERAVVHPARTLSGLMVAELTRWSREFKPTGFMTADLKTMQFQVY